MIVITYKAQLHIISVCVCLCAVFQRLREIGGPPLALHGLVVCLVVLCFVFSAISILISLYNSVSNPYETYMGPIGIYTCSSLSSKCHEC